MRDNFDLWLEFANSESSGGLGLKDEDLMFVSAGTVQTSRWAVAAFSRHSAVHKGEIVSTDFGSFPELSTDIYHGPLQVPDGFYRTGPSMRQFTANAKGADTQPPAGPRGRVFERGREQGGELVLANEGHCAVRSVAVPWGDGG